MDSLAKKIHSHAGTDSCNIVCTEKMNDLVKGINDVIFCYYYLCVFAADVVCNLLCVFKVDSVCIHTDCKGTNGLVALTLCNCAYK